MTENIKKQIEAIRKSGETNMLDVNMVQRTADREDYYDLAIFIEEHRKEYVEYLLSGHARQS